MFKNKKTSIGNSSSILNRLSNYRKSVKKKKEEKNMETIKKVYSESISDWIKRITNSSDSVQTGKNMQIDELLAENSIFNMSTVAVIINSLCANTENDEICRETFFAKYPNLKKRGFQTLYALVNDLFFDSYVTYMYVYKNNESLREARKKKDREQLEYEVNKMYHELEFNKVHFRDKDKEIFTLKVYNIDDDNIFWEEIEKSEEHYLENTKSENDTSSMKKLYLKKYNEFFKNTFYIKLRF